MDHAADFAATLPFLKRALLSLALTAACAVASRAADDLSACQAAGWDMTREVKAYAGSVIRVAAADATSNTPVLKADTLYAITLRPQSVVHFVQESPNAPRAPAAMAGLARFSVPGTGRYRLTVDTALWIDAVDAGSIIAPAGYITWHQCPWYRKSIEYQFHAGQSIVLQLSGANAALARVTIETIPD